MESLTSEPLGRTWTEEELRECCKELGIENSYVSSFELGSLESEYSNDLCTSERSLGQQIIAMAQEVKTSDVHCTLPLEPGIEGKPPLPHNHKLTTLENKHSSGYFYDRTHDPLFEKLSVEHRIGDRETLRSQSACSLRKYTEIMQDDLLYNPANAKSEAYIRKYSFHEENLLDSNVNDKQFLAQSSVRQKIASSNLARLSFETEYFNKPGNAQNDDLLSENFTDLKFHHWFPDYNVHIRSSQLTIAEKETDMLLEILAREQQIFNCTNTYDSLNTDSLYSKENSKKDRDQELRLECLVEEDINEDEVKNVVSTEYSDKPHSAIRETQSVEDTIHSNNPQSSAETEKEGQNTATLENMSNSSENGG